MKRFWDRFSRWTLAVVLVFALIGAAAGMLRTYLKDYNYTATATVYVTPPISSGPSDALTADQYAANRTQLYLSLIGSPELARAVLDRLKINQSPEDLAKRVEGKATPQTSLLSITASGSSPTDAGNVATAYAESLSSFARTVEGTAGLRSSPSVITVALPVAKDPGIVKRYGVTIALTVGAGLLGLLYSLAYRRRFPNVLTTDQLRKELRVALVEHVDVSRPERQLRRLQAELFTDADPGGSLMIVGARSRDQAEEFSKLLEESMQDSDRSARRGDGSSTRRSKNGSASPPRAADLVDIPALLENSSDAAILHRTQSGEALVITRHNVTSLRDAKEVIDLLGMNNIAVRGAIILRHGKFTRRGHDTPPELPTTDDQDSRFPWPAIDVLEAEKAQRVVRAD